MVNIKQFDLHRKVTVMITSPLERVYATKIAEAQPERTEVIYRPDLIPPPRYVGDHKGDPDWHRTPEAQAEWLTLLKQAEVLWDFPVHDHENLMELTPKLRWVQTTSAGIGQLVASLGLHGSKLIITTASGIHAQPLAEFVFGTLLFHTKRIVHLQTEQRAHHWERFCGQELATQTLAIVGPGRIGQEIARIAKAFRMNVWAMARDNDPARAVGLGIDKLFSRGQLRTMLAGADCVVLCMPHTPETEGLIGHEELLAMKSNAVFINIARGAVVDETALIEVLQQGHISFAALDVFRTEPLAPESPLWDLPNVLISPHSASTADSENNKLIDVFIRNLAHYLDGEFSHMAPALDITRLY